MCGTQADRLQKLAGARIEPPVSEPSAIRDFLATDAVTRDEDPPVTRSGAAD